MANRRRGALGPEPECRPGRKISILPPQPGYGIARRRRRISWRTGRVVQVALAAGDLHLQFRESGAPAPAAAATTAAAASTGDADLPGRLGDPGDGCLSATATAAAAAAAAAGAGTGLKGPVQRSGVDQLRRFDGGRDGPGSNSRAVTLWGFRRGVVRARSKSAPSIDTPGGGRRPPFSISSRWLAKACIRSPALGALGWWRARNDSNVRPSDS